MFLFLFGIVAIGATDLCLPMVHQGHVSISTDIEADTPFSHHHDEYYEGDHMHIWFDGTTKKTLVHVYEEEWYNHQGKSNHIFSLRDYGRKYHWRGNWNHDTQTVTDCYVEKFDRAFEQYCVARDAKIQGSGTIGSGGKVDFYDTRYEDDDRHFFEDLHTITEAGSISTVVQERTFGEHYNETEQILWTWIEHREWFDFSEDAIPASTFTVPAGCPSV